MSVTFAGRLHRQPTAPPRARSLARPSRRVRYEVRDGLAVVVFTALASSVLSVVLAALVRLAG